MKQVLSIGPATSVKGGITTVVTSYLSSDLSKNYRIVHISSHRDGNKLVKLITALSGLIQVLFFLTFRKIDIVHIHGSDTTSSLRKYFFFRVIEKFGCKTIYHFHGASFLELFASKSRTWQQKIIYLFTHVDKVICLSKDWEKKINQLIPKARTVVIENAVNLPTVSEKAISDKNKAVSLLFLGLIGERKGIFDLLPVVETLKSKGYPIVLNIGGNGDISRLENEIKQLGLTGTVNFLGWITGEKKNELLTGSDIYILPSYGEGMPMSVLEAMSFGLPIVSTQVGGIPNLVKDGKTGFLVQPGDKEDLQFSILKLVENPDLRVRFGMNARKTIATCYNLKVAIRRIDDVYQELLNMQAE